MSLCKRKWTPGKGVENRVWVVDYFDQTDERKGVGEGLAQYDRQLPGKVGRVVVDGKRRGRLGR